MGSATEPQYVEETEFNLSYTETPSPYRAVNTLRLGYKNQSVNVV